MAKLVSTTREEFHTYSTTFRLTMGSGKQHHVTISGEVDYYFTLSGNIEHYLLKPEYILKRRIKRKEIVNNVNYGLVESFKLDESFIKKIIVTQKTYRKYFIYYYNEYEITEEE